MSELKDKAASGLFWGGSSNIVQQLLSLVFGIFLARLLSPGDYGMVGMLAIFSAIASTIQESGFTVALINRKKLDSIDYDSVFWFSLTSGIVFYLILFFSAPLIAEFFHSPELVKLSRYVFLSFLINSFCISQNAYLLKTMQIKKKAIASMSSILISGVVGVVMAFLGCSYWGIATQQLAASLVLAVFYHFMSDWKPSFHFSIKPVKEMFSFSFRILITSLFSIFSTNLVSVILGRYYTKVDVGYYNQGKKWAGMSMEAIIGTLRNISQPVLAESNDDDARQLRVFRKLIRFTSFVTFPALFGLALISPELITVAITDKWQESAAILRIICVGNAFVILESVFTYLYMARKKTSFYMWNSIAFGLTNIALMIYMSHYGIIAMVASNTVLSILWFIIYFIYARKIIGYRFADFISDIFPYMLIALSDMVVTYFATVGIHNIYILLAVRVMMAAILYCIIMYLSDSVIFKDCVDFVRKKRLNL